MEKNIKDLLVVYMEEKKKILSNEKDEKLYKLIINRIDNRNILADERERINTSQGTWHFTADQNHMVYGVLTSNDYSERLAFQMITELITELSNYKNLHVQNPQISQEQCNAFIKGLISKYENPSAITNINMAANAIEDTKLVMNSNLKKIYNNHTNLQEIESKAEKMNTNAQAFHKNSTSLAKIMAWRNMKVKIVIGIIMLCIIIYIFVPIIVQTTK